MMQKLSEAIDEAYHIGDTLIFLREYPTDNVAIDRKASARESENYRSFEKDLSAAS